MSKEIPPPLDLTVHQSSKVLEIEFANGVMEVAKKPQPQAPRPAAPEKAPADKKPQGERPPREPRAVSPRRGFVPVSSPGYQPYSPVAALVGL